MVETEKKSRKKKEVAIWDLKQTKAKRILLKFNQTVFFSTFEKTSEFQDCLLKMADIEKSNESNEGNFEGKYLSTKAKV